MSGVPVAPCTHSTGWILVHEHALPARLGERAVYLSNDRPFIACCVSTIITTMMLFVISPLTNFFRIFFAYFWKHGRNTARSSGWWTLAVAAREVRSNQYLSLQYAPAFADDVARRVRDPSSNICTFGTFQTNRS